MDLVGFPVSGDHRSQSKTELGREGTVGSSWLCDGACRWLILITWFYIQNGPAFTHRIDCSLINA